MHAKPCKYGFKNKLLFLLQIVLTTMVYEKQKNLRIMMKMYELGDGPCWMISYTYFLAISLVYRFCFVLFGSVIGTNQLTLNYVFYFDYFNLLS